ncbi:hypothetical protein NQ151_011035 [Microbacterium sp. zg-YB36]|nr:DUF222 domain-containing protein [Microbacterium sp. zg-YB36]MDL5352115.1 hypothetical protein [Microbacterium sp. zg-YB36]
MTTSPAFTRIDTRSRSSVMADAEKARRKAGAAAADELQLMARAEVIAAEQTARIPSSAGREREMPRREIAAELAATLHVSERGMVDRMHDAWVLVEQFPSTVAALRAGRVGRGMCG